MFDVLIIGAGPAGKAAAVQAAAFKLSVLILAKDEPRHAEAPENVLLNLPEIAKSFQEIVQAGSVVFKPGTVVTSLEKNIVSFSAEDKSGQIYYARTAVIASGFDSQKNMAYADFESLTQKDFSGKIKVDANMATNIPGLFAAGDSTVGFKLGSGVAAAEGIKAVLAVKEYLTKVSN